MSKRRRGEIIREVNPVLSAPQTVANVAVMVRAAGLGQRAWARTAARNLDLPYNRVRLLGTGRVKSIPYHEYAAISRRMDALLEELRGLDAEIAQIEREALDAARGTGAAHPTDETLLHAGEESCAEGKGNS